MTMTEYKFNNVTVRIHGKAPDREKLEKSCIRFVSQISKQTAEKEKK